MNICLFPLRLCLCHETNTFFLLHISDSRVGQKQASFNNMGAFERISDIDTLPHDRNCVSLLDCADLCIRNIECVAYNFLRDYNECKLYGSPSVISNMHANSRWQYYELDVFGYDLLT